MKQDKAEKIIKKAELKAKKAAQQVEVASKKTEAAKQKQEARAQKKAAKIADKATKKAAKTTKKADAAAKKAQLAAKKAEEKKAKAVAKAAAKAVGGSKSSEEGGEGGAPGGKKKNKKKTLLMAVPVIAVAVGVGVFFFLKGGGDEEEEAPPEPISAPAEYVLVEGGVGIPALPVWGNDVLVYREEVAPEPPAEPEEDEAKTIADSGEEGEEDSSEESSEKSSEEEADAFTKILYRYEGLQSPVDLISAYASLLTTADAGFSNVDESLTRIDLPEEFGARGAVQLARNVPQAEDGTGGGVQSLLLSWDSVTCSVTLDMPDGKVRDPAPEPVASTPRRGLSDLEALHPSVLGLPGETMDDYELIPQDGSVIIAGSTCMRVNVFDQDSQIAGSYFLSNSGKLYKLDETVNGVVELDWE